MPNLYYSHMRTPVILLAVLCFAINGHAQSLENEPQYFNKHWSPVSDPKKAVFYRTVEYKDSTRFVVRDYFISGKIQRIAECSQVAPRLIYEGKNIVYYENGAIKEETNYRNDEKIGIYKSYYMDGGLEFELYNTPGRKTKYITYINSAGTTLLSNGNGMIPARSVRGEKSFTLIEDSVATGLGNVDELEQDTQFYRVDKEAQFKGGLEALARYLQLTVKYPSEARRRGIQGTVFVTFMVDERGAVRDWEVVKGLSADCDAAALNAVASMDEWIPAEYKGVPVKSRFVILINFKLPSKDKP
jgi:protein TonB